MSSLAQIQCAAAAHFGLTEEEILGSNRRPRCAWPRQLAMALAREDGHSLHKIGRYFGRHHTTVLRAAHAVSKRRDDIAPDVAAIRAALACQAGGRFGTKPARSGSKCRQVALSACDLPAERRT